MGFSTLAKDSALDRLGDQITLVSLHTDDPGDTGANEIVGGTYARVSVTWDPSGPGPASKRSKAASNQPVLNVPAGSRVWFIGYWSTGGDFSGPASAVDSNLVGFNGTGGKTGKDSGITAASVSSAVTNSHASGSDAETTGTIGSMIAGATAKATPVDADEFGFSDSAASDVLKSLTWANIKTLLWGVTGTRVTKLWATDVESTNAPTVGGVVYAPSWKAGLATKNPTDASTTQNIAHGLGRVPKFVRVTATLIYTSAITEQCFGCYDGTNHSGSALVFTEGTSTATTDNIYSSATQELGFTALGSTSPFNGANRQTGVITVDATNIIITWTKAGTIATGTANILWECC